MKKNLLTAVLMTVVTTLLLGLIYPLIVTRSGPGYFSRQSKRTINQGCRRNRDRLPFDCSAISSPGYFRSRPSAAGANGYDAGASSGSNLGPTNQKLIDRIKADVEKLQAENPGKPVPIDLVTTSGSGLDPHITPAAAEFQVPRVARECGMNEDELRRVVATHTEGRQFGFLRNQGERIRTQPEVRSGATHAEVNRFLCAISAFSVSPWLLYLRFL